MVVSTTARITTTSLPHCLTRYRHTHSPRGPLSSPHLPPPTGVPHHYVDLLPASWGTSYPSHCHKRNPSHEGKPTRQIPTVSSTPVSPPKRGIPATSPWLEAIGLTPLTPRTSQEGEKALGLSSIGCCLGYSYFGTIVARDVDINAAHVNGRHPVHGVGQEFIYLMTCSPLSHPADL